MSGQPLPDFLAERVFAPLGMPDPGFEVPGGKRGRFTSDYRATPAGGLELADGPDGQWSTLPPFPLGNGGLAGTADDWPAFGRMLAEGTAAAGRRLPPCRFGPADDQRPHHPGAQRETGRLFLQGQGWGSGGPVDLAAIDPWNVPGRYGWAGGTGTPAHITPSTGTTAILLTQVAADSPLPQAWMPAFWRYATNARRCRHQERRLATAAPRRSTPLAACLAQHPGPSTTSPTVSRGRRQSLAGCLQRGLPAPRGLTPRSGGF